MKRLCLGLFSFFYIFSLVAQKGTVSSGGDFSSASGSISYSVGQIDFQHPTSAQGTVLEGLQVPYEVYVIVGIEAVDIDLKTRVFPNPVSSKLFLEIEDFKNLDYRLFSISGNLLKEEKITHNLTEIDVSTYSSSSFILTILNEDQALKTFKIIKK